jgi:hypothetical protein
MSGKLVSVLIAAGMFSMLFVSGCGQSADLSLKLSPEQSVSYKSTSEVTKLFRFDQPNLGKLKEEQSKHFIEMDFTQTVQEIDAEGNATALITIKDLKVDYTNKNESQLSFDSQNEADKNTPMAKLLGQSYTIQISPTGQVKLLDAKDALAAVTSSFEKNIARGILDPKAVTKRHQIAAIPEDSTGALSVNDSWSKVVPSPPGLLAPKSYNKTYTLTAIDGSIATIEMTAGVSGEGDTGSSGSMGIFAKMFDNTDEYSGTSKINLTTGDVIASKEKLISTYIAQEMPENGDPEKGPDVLTMQFIHCIELEKLD